MIRPSVLALQAAACLLTLLPAYAAAPAAIKDIAAYKAHMDEVQDLKDRLSDAIEGKNEKDAATLSHQLTTLLQQDEAFWQQQKVSTAVELSRTTLQLSGDLERSATKADFPAAHENFKRLQTSCRNCHDAHPEKQLK